MLTIVDRVAISAAKGDMSRDLGLTDITFGLIFGSFALGYALFQIPAGYFADRFGPRRVVAAVVIAWSLLTTTTAMVRGAALLIGVRFFFGAAEAGAFPASARAIRSWLPVRETGIAQGVLFGGSRLGAAFGLTLVSWLVAWLNWRAPFFILGALGIVWVTAWLLWFRNTPEEVSGVSETELAYIRAGRADPPRQSGAGGCFAAATFGVDLTLSPSWTLCIDIAGDRTGTLSGAMNMFGNIGSFVSSVAFPLLLRWTGASDAYFYCAAAINLLAAGLWMAMRERDRLRG